MKPRSHAARRWKTPASALVLFLVLAAMALGCAGEPPPKPAPADSLTIQEVLQIPGFSADELFEGAKIWVADSFSHSLDVIRYANRREKMVVGKTKMPHFRDGPFGSTQRLELRFTVMVETKNERLRYTFTDMRLMAAYGTETVLETDMETIRPKLDAAAAALAASFKRTEEKEDW
ncbi:MAG: DUF4468 domain-containing protein [Desulfococcaceae bacterium]